MKTLTLILFSVACVAALAIQTHDHHKSVDSRGDMVMGFSHEKTTHHFRLYKDGGAIQVTVNDPADKQDLEAIRSHLQKVAKVFASGDLTMPMMVHNTTIPGLETMKRLHSKISYRYEELPTGGSVRIRTGNHEALHAVHGFLKLQVKDHRTGDAGSVESAATDHADCPLMKAGKCPFGHTDKH